MISLSPEQSTFLTDSAKMSCALGGRGSGKSYVGSVWSLRMALENPWVVGLIGASNPAQLNSVCVRQFTQLLDQEEIAWVKGKEPSWYQSRFAAHTNVLSIENGAQVFLRSFHDSGANRNIRGLTTGWAWLDESRELTEDVFDITLATLREQHAPNQIRLTSTPNGRDWQWRRFINEPMKGSSWHTWTSEANKHLPPDFIENLRNALDEQTFQQEVLAMIIDSNATRVYRFSRTNVSKDLPPFVTSPTLVFSLDLNVQPCCGILMLTDGNLAHVVKEVIINNDATTELMCIKAISLMSDIQRADMAYLCDEAGLARSTRTTTNDAQVMQQVFSVIPDARSLNGRGKPHVVESVNQLNGLMAPASGKIRLTIDPCCKKLIADLESVSWGEGEPRKIDKSDKSLTHATDALRYACWATTRKIQVGSFNMQDVKTLRPQDRAVTTGEIRSWQPISR